MQPIEDEPQETSTVTLAMFSQTNLTALLHPESPEGLMLQNSLPRRVYLRLLSLIVHTFEPGVTYLLPLLVHLRLEYSYRCPLTMSAAHPPKFETTEHPLLSLVLARQELPPGTTQADQLTLPTSLFLKLRTQESKPSQDSRLPCWDQY